MTIEQAKGGLVWASAILAAISAFCWYRASVAYVSKDEATARGEGGFNHGNINVWLSVRKQGQWNKWGAILMAASVACQAVAYAL